MKHLAMALFLAAAGHAAEIRIVFTGDDAIPATTLQIAHAQATWMFARIGVTVRWQHAAANGAAIHVRYSKSTPAVVHARALAYANPFSPDQEITIFYDRIHFLADQRPGYEPRLLAHVLAHEIGHVLQRTDAHSESGVMKARWSVADHHDMARRPLAFTDADRQGILAGLGVK